MKLQISIENNKKNWKNCKKPKEKEAKRRAPLREVGQIVRVRVGWKDSPGFFFFVCFFLVSSSHFTDSFRIVIFRRFISQRRIDSFLSSDDSSQTRRIRKFSLESRLRGKLAICREMDIFHSEYTNVILAVTDNMWVVHTNMYGRWKEFSFPLCHIRISTNGPLSSRTEKKKFTYVDVPAMILKKLKKEKKKETTT